MKQKVKALLSNTATYVRAFTFLSLVALASPSVLLAQTGIEIPDSGVDWTGIGDEIMNTIKVPLLAAIGVALAIWLVLLCLRIVKRAAR